MDNVQFVEVENLFDRTTTTHVIIDRGSGEYTSMPKAVWDQQQKAAEQSGTL